MVEEVDCHEQGAEVSPAPSPAAVSTAAAASAKSPATSVLPVLPGKSDCMTI